MIRTEQRDSITWVILDRPERRNAITRPMIDGLNTQIGEALSDRGCRGVVITGASGHFSAGRDLSGSTQATDLPGYLERDDAWTNIFKQLAGASKPTVAVVEGYAVAGGFTLAMACDFVLAHQQAKFGALEMRNQFPAAINTPLLGKIASPRIGLELAMTGSIFSAERLYSAGLINHLAESTTALTALADDFTSHLAGLDPDAVVMTKELHRAATTMPLNNSLDMGKLANALLAASGRIGEAEARYSKK